MRSRHHVGLYAAIALVSRQCVILTQMVCFRPLVGYWDEQQTYQFTMDGEHTCRNWETIDRWAKVHQLTDLPMNVPV